MSLSIAAIVEGHAEVESVPLLLRRIFAQLGVSDIQVARPFRVKRNRVVKAGELERAIRQTIQDRAEVGGIMVLIDSDDIVPRSSALSFWIERRRRHQFQFQWSLPIENSNVGSLAPRRLFEGSVEL